VEHLQPEVMASEAENAESVNDVQVCHSQHHQQMVEAHMGRMLQGKKLSQLSYCSHMPDLQQLFIVKTSNLCQSCEILTHKPQN
jgi:hypothetical protein